ncbi:MAG: GFA family protein [Rhodospirillaceae bacterium]|nr:GFA family protein [Rhodospirillaceae bacterium]
MRVDGGCHCGRITYQAEIDPALVLICHCTDCQAISGTAFRVSLRTPEDSFELLSGTPKTYVRIADSGAKRAQVFCGDCGSHLYATSVDEGAGGGPKQFGIRVGTIKQRAQLPPQRQVWCRSAQGWLGEIPALPRSEKQ